MLPCMILRRLPLRPWTVCSKRLKCAGSPPAESRARCAAGLGLLRLMTVHTHFVAQMYGV